MLVATKVAHARGRAPRTVPPVAPPTVQLGDELRTGGGICFEAVPRGGHVRGAHRPGGSRGKYSYVPFHILAREEEPEQDPCSGDGSSASTGIGERAPVLMIEVPKHCQWESKVLYEQKADPELKHRRLKA